MQPILKILPPLDPQFCPAVLANRAFHAATLATGCAVPLGIAIEQADGSVFHARTELLPQNHPQAAANFLHVERLIKFLLWSRGGWRIHLAGPEEVTTPLQHELQAHYRDTATGRFDSDVIGSKIFDQPLAIVTTHELPHARASTMPLGRHLEGCRIGFDLGGSDRKVAAVIDGKVVFSDETVWDPYFQTDPKYHYEGILDSLRKAAAHLPRVDAIGGSAAGCYVNNRVKAASLFRGVSEPDFAAQVREMFLKIGREWNVPLEVVNDGEVTALAGAMSLGQNAVLGIAMGTSQAAGFVTREGNITTGLNELAFAPVEHRADAPVDEWSGDRGCGAQYFSQQAVGRLLAPADIEADAAMPLPEKLKLVQSLMAAGDARARAIYETIGVYLGYGVAHYADFYDFDHVLVLGRVMSGAGGDVILERARAVLKAEFPTLAARVQFHTPSETDKRHGQAVAAASLPKLC